MRPSINFLLKRGYGEAEDGGIEFSGVASATGLDFILASPGL